MKFATIAQVRLVCPALFVLLTASRTLCLATSTISHAPSSGVQLTYQLTGNSAFGRAMSEQLQQSGERMVGRLCLPLVEGAVLRSKPVGCPKDHEQAHAVLHAVVLRDGEIWRLYSTHPKLLEAPVSLGSISKAVVGVPLLAHANARADEVWCPQTFGGFHNADGSSGVADCHASHAEVPATVAMARSNNLATIWRLRQLPAQATRDHLKSLNIANVPTDYHPGIAVALGVVEVSPRQTVECFDALISGSPRRAAMVQRAPAKPSAYAQWCAGAVAQPAGSQFVHTMLSAPADLGGTARFLRSALPGADALYAKTGTPANAQRMDNGKALVGSFSRQGHRYTFLLALLSSRVASPLAPHLAAADLRGFVEVIDRHTRSDNAINVPASTHLIQKAKS